MKTYRTWDELIEEAESNMLKREENKDYCFAVYESMHHHFDSCLSRREYEPLLDLLPYFEEPDSYPRLYHSGETRKLHILLNFLKLELKHEKDPFLSTVNDFDGFLNQYLLTVFAMRRLELELSEDSMAWAYEYLTSIPFSVYAARIIAENEYFENYGNLYWNLYTCMKSIWPIEDKILCLHYLLNEEPSSRVLLELSSLYIEIHDFSKAYQCLISIPSPSQEVTTLISSLKELLRYE